MLPIDLPHAGPNYCQNKCIPLYIRDKVDCFREKCQKNVQMAIFVICFTIISPQRPHMGWAWACVSEVVGAECKVTQAMLHHKKSHS